MGCASSQILPLYLKDLHVARIGTQIRKSEVDVNIRKKPAETSEIYNRSKEKGDSIHVVIDKDNRSTKSEHGCTKDEGLDLLSKDIDKNANDGENTENNLREGGFLSIPKSQRKGGIYFEVIQVNPGPKRRPKKLERLTKRKNFRKNFTREHIENKLDRAEIRRQILEEKLITRLQLDWLDILSVVDRVRLKKRVRRKIREQMKEAAYEKRQHILENIRLKMRQHAKHADEVRQRKLSYEDDY